MPIHDWNRTYGCARILLLALLVVVVSNGGTQAQTTAPSGGSFEERFIFRSFEELFSSPAEAAPAPVPSRDETVRPRISKETVEPPPRASREPARVGEQRPQPRTAKKIGQRQTSEPAAGARNAKRLASKSGRRIAGGLATWHEQLGRKASRTKYNPNALTAAHKTLRLGTRVRVVNLLNKRSVTVRISDRAPSKMKNVIDLSRGSARAIGLTDVPVALYRASDSTAKATSFTSTSGFAGQTTKTAEPTDPPERPGTPVAGTPSAESATTGMATQEVTGNAVLQLDREEIAMFRRRGEELVLAGDIIAARLLLQRAAEDRDAGAALALGATYDPIVLERLGVYALAADIATARIWYEKAKEFGSAEAPRRLELLATLGH
jgi:rare lipoprotein A (peptidoglycan hydrolase)